MIRAVARRGDREVRKPRASGDDPDGTNPFLLVRA